MSDDPTGKRALFSGQPGQDLAAEGKEALFSNRDSGPGPFKIECSRCHETTHIAAVEALRRIVPFSIWVPGKRFSRRLRCPSCHRTAWVKVTIDRDLP